MYMSIYNVLQKDTSPSLGHQRKRQGTIVVWFKDDTPGLVSFGCQLILGDDLAMIKGPSCFRIHMKESTFHILSVL